MKTNPKPNGNCAAESLLPANGKQLLSARTLEQLLEAEGFGLFHVALLVFTAIGYAGCTMTSFSIPWVLPAADVELSLTSVRKGWINALNVIGRIFGNLVISSLSDSLGRKRVLLFCCFLMTLSGTLSSIVIHFAMLLILSFISGISVGGFAPTGWTYTSEFFPSSIKRPVLMLWALSSEIGHLSLSVMAWVLLGTPLGDESAFSIHGFNISKWRVLLLAVSIPPTLAFVSVCFLPESLEYLNQSHKKKQLQSALQKVEKWNEMLSCSRNRKQHDIDSSEMLLAAEDDSELLKDFKRLSILQNIKAFITKTLKQSIQLFRQPYLVTTVILLFGSFMVSYSYNGVYQWFPEYFKRLRLNGSLCDGSNSSIVVSEDYYQDTIFVTAGALSGGILGLAFIDIFGSKILLVSSMALATASAVGMWSFKTNVRPAVASSFVYSAMTLLAFNVQQVYIIGKYEADIRSTCLGYMLICGKAGAVLSTLLFGYFIDCRLSFIILIIVCITGAGSLISLFLPPVKFKKLPYMHRLVAKILKPIQQAYKRAKF